MISQNKLDFTIANVKVSVKVRENKNDGKCKMEKYYVVKLNRDKLKTKDKNWIFYRSKESDRALKRVLTNFEVKTEINTMSKVLMVCNDKVFENTSQ